MLKTIKNVENSFLPLTKTVKINDFRLQAVYENGLKSIKDKCNN
jgi:hypothetical protein